MPSLVLFAEVFGVLEKSFYLKQSNQSISVQKKSKIEPKEDAY